jgi:hypothetical protein
LDQVLEPVGTSFSPVAYRLKQRGALGSIGNANIDIKIKNVE